jgi:hypothetical protein
VPERPWVILVSELRALVPAGLDVQEHSGSGWLGVTRAHIHHRPRPLQGAEAQIDLNTMPPLEVSEDDPVVHFSRRQDVVL